MRVGELVRLRVSDLVERNQHQFLKVRGKGDRERLVPLAPTLYRRWARYAERQGLRAAASDRLFLSRRRSRLTRDYEALTESGCSSSSAPSASGPVSVSGSTRTSSATEPRRTCSAAA